MDLVRTHGHPPCRVAVLHGGPGAPGSAAGLARALASGRGVLEPLQSADSVFGQVEELHAQMEGHALRPVTLIGHSWGAWLACLYAARHPRGVARLVLVGAPPFEESFAAQVLGTRLARLGEEGRADALRLMDAIRGGDPPSAEDLARLGTLFARADAFEPMEPPTAALAPVQPGVFRRVWGEAAELRRSGALLAAARRIACPVLALHGDHDPHPAAGVAGPLRRVVLDFRFVLLERCGHEPWNEVHAREAFRALLERELPAEGDGA